MSAAAERPGAPAVLAGPGVPGTPSDDGDATGGGPQINAENAAEYGEED